LPHAPRRSSDRRRGERARRYYTTKHCSLIDLGSGWMMVDVETGERPERRPETDSRRMTSGSVAI
jgi:hypothetical protein